MKPLLICLSACVSLLAGDQWQKLLELKGNGIKQSETFTTRSREVKISWATKAQHSGVSIFQIYVHRSSDDHLVELAANTTAEGDDSTLVRMPTGQYYLKINSANRFVVVIEDKP